MVKVSLRTYHLFFGLIALGTLAYDFTRNIHDIVNYFSYFTTLSNVLAAALFLYVGLTKKEQIAKINFDVLRGAVIIYLLISAGVYELLLANIADPTRVAWVDFVLHRLIPTAAIIGWILYPPHHHLNLKSILTWLIFPFFYISYTLVRGAIGGWYPYYFLNPMQRGYIGVFSFSFKLLAIVIVISFLIIVIGNILKSYKNRL